MDDIQKFFFSPQIKGVIQYAFLIFARLTPIIAFSPVLGGQTLPKRVRMGLGFFLTMALVPMFIHNPEQVTVQPQGLYLLLLGKEALVGLSLSLILLVLFETVASMGALVDLARGATMANVLDPLTQNQQSILAVFFTQVAIVLFLSVGGLQILIRVLGESFVILKPTELIPLRLFGPQATTEVIGLVGDLFMIAFKLGAPTVVVLVLVDFGLGVINRVAPSIQVYFLGMTTKGCVGLLVLFGGIALTYDLLVEQFGRGLHTIHEWVTTMARG